jgi:hypothetical protein
VEVSGGYGGPLSVGAGKRAHGSSKGGLHPLHTPESLSFSSIGLYDLDTSVARAGSLIPSEGGPFDPLPFIIALICFVQILGLGPTDSACSI